MFELGIGLPVVQQPLGGRRNRRTEIVERFRSERAVRTLRMVHVCSQIEVHPCLARSGLDPVRQSHVGLVA